MKKYLTGAFLFIATLFVSIVFSNNIIVNAVDDTGSVLGTTQLTTTPTITTFMTSTPTLTPTATPATTGSSTNWVIILLIGFIVIVIGGIAYFIFARRK